MPRSLKDAEPSIRDFLSEATQCANQGLGFAAMLTIFPVILSVAEAVYKSRSPMSNPEDKDLFKAFIPEMHDKSWLILRNPTHSISDHEIAIDLFSIRNGLAHQLSLPSHICQVNRKSDAPGFFGKYSRVQRIISVVDFVAAVDDTVNELITKHPTIAFDPSPRGATRAPAKGVTLLNGSSGSPAGE